MRYAFSDCVLDTERREITRGSEVIAVRPKVFQVLTYLIEHRDRVVPKQELFDEIWNGRVVGDATLNSCLKEARRAIGDSGREQRILKTLHGHGYHFVAPLVNDSHGASETDAIVVEAPGVLLSDRELKQVSVLTCTIANLADIGIDAEAVDDLMRRFFAAADEILQRYGGSVTERSGDGLTILFGAPQAWEDHARRAALAAFELHQAVNELRSRSGAQSIDLHAGLHSGAVVVGAVADQLFSSAGDTVQYARRLRDQSDGETLASNDFHTLIEYEIEAEARTLSTGEIAHALRRPFRLRSGVPLRRRMLATFVGRNDEVSIVMKRLALAEKGTGQTVCISGEPGIGKSRLVHELGKSFGAYTCWQANCLHYRYASPYFPLKTLLRQACGTADEADGEVAAANIRKHCSQAGISDASAIELILRLLDAGDERVTGPTVRQTDRESILRPATQLLLQASRPRPQIIIIEDLHWLDASSEEWLAYFVSRITAEPVLVLLTYRPGYQAAWLTHSSVTQVALPRLNDENSGVLIGSLAPLAQSSDQMKRHIVSSAQGNPFFLEELTYNLGKNQEHVAVEVPRTVQAVLASRIDQLASSDKSLLQMAAVMGTQVPHALLAAVLAQDKPDIEAAIRRLEAGEFLFEQLAEGGRLYHFKHALTRDVAYQSLLKNARRRCHERIAETYRSQFAKEAALHPELLAQHFGEAGFAEKAMHYWQEAGIRAAQRSAHPEAVTHFEKALAVGESLPQTDELKKRQLDIYLMLGPPLMSSKAFTSPAVEAAYLKARRLSDEVGTNSDLLTVLWGLWLHYAHRGRIGDARPLSRQILRIAAEVNDDALTLQAHHAAWTTELWHGDLKVCNEHALEGIRLYDRDKHHEHAYLFGGHDPGVCARGTAAITAWFLGRPDEAIRLAHEGAALASELDHPYTRIITLYDLMEIESLRGNVEAAGHYGRAAIEACTEQRAPNYLAVGHIFAGYEVAVTQDFDRGLAQIKDGLRRYRDLGAERNLTAYLTLLMQLSVENQRCDVGLAAAEEAQMMIGRTSESRWAPEISRLKGELLIAQSTTNADEADALFRESMDLAATQGCLSFELRAATSLARLLKNQGQAMEARDVLQPRYEQFSEGFDTRDLKDAAALLQALN